MDDTLIKREDVTESSPVLDRSAENYAFSGMIYFSEADKSSLGFLELLGMQDFSPLLDLPQHSSLAVKDAPKTVKECSEAMNQQPTTPIYSSISSESSEALNDELTKTVDQEEDQPQRTKKQLRTKKTDQKKQREPRFAFVTKSEVDHLEDGYRWRKYGQKAVKNSPFPRSYYRCTTASCNVKKRVERSFNDPSTVVTTYEGQHTHPSPVMFRPNLAGASTVSDGVSTGYGSTALAPATLPRNLPYYQLHNQQPHFSCLSSLSFPYIDSTSTNTDAFLHERRPCHQQTAFLKDHGLLQDIVPSNMLKEE